MMTSNASVSIVIRPLLPYPKTLVSTRERAYGWSLFERIRSFRKRGLTGKPNETPL
jgi:hypothetical protein